MSEESKNLTPTAVLDGPNQWKDYFYWKVRGDDGVEYKIRTKSADQERLKIGEAADFKIYPPKEDGDEPFLSRQGYEGGGSGGSGGGSASDSTRQASIIRQSCYKVAGEVVAGCIRAGKLDFESVKDLAEKVRRVERLIENDVLNVADAKPAPTPEPVAIVAAATSASDEIPF